MILGRQLGPRVLGIEIPCRFHCVANEPAPLGGMSRPWPTTPWSAPVAAGIHGVPCLESEASDYDPAPVGRLLCVDMEDLEGRQKPRGPEREHALILGVVPAVMGTLASGEGVIVHRWGGSGRTGVGVAASFSKLGHSTEEVIAFLESVQDAGARVCGLTMPGK